MLCHRTNLSWTEDPGLYPPVCMVWEDSKDTDILEQFESSTRKLTWWGKNLSRQFKDEIQDCYTHLNTLRPLRDNASLQSYSNYRGKLV